MKRLLPYIDCGYKVNGRGPDQFDCYGLIVSIYKNLFKITLPDLINVYGCSGDKIVPRLFIEQARDSWERMPTEQAIFGDVLVFNIFGKPRHCGIFIEKNKMMHILDKSFVSYEEFTSIRWKRRFEGVFRYVGNK